MTQEQDTLRRIGRAAKSRVTRAVWRAGRLIGVEPHRASEGRDYWDDRGARYKSEVRSILDPADPYFKAQQEFLAALRAEEWTSILEVGCGFGWHLRAVHSAFPDRCSAGLDFSFTQLQEARRYSGGARGLLQAGAAALPFADGAFDIVFTSGLLVCIHPDGVQAVMQELARVARRSVIALEYAREHVTTPTARETMEAAPWHGHRFRELYAAANLDLVRAEPFAAFAAEPDRVPLSFFEGRRRDA